MDAPSQPRHRPTCEGGLLYLGHSDVAVSLCPLVVVCSLGLHRWSVLVDVVCDSTAEPLSPKPPRQIGINGCRLIASVLGSPTCRLRTLCLANNRIGDPAAEALASGLRHCLSLRRLSLRSNALSHRGGSAIADAVGQLLDCVGVGRIAIGDGAE